MTSSPSSTWPWIDTYNASYAPDVTNTSLSGSILRSINFEYSVDNAFTSLGWPCNGKIIFQLPLVRSKANNSNENKQTHKTARVLIEQMVGSICDGCQCIGDVFRHRVVGETLSQVYRLILLRQTAVLIPAGQRNESIREIEARKNVPNTRLTALISFRQRKSIDSRLFGWHIAALQTLCGCRCDSRK